MRDLQKFFEALFLLLFSTSFIFGATFGGAKAYEYVFPPVVEMNNGTLVGPVQVGGLTKEEAQEKVKEAIAEWKKNTVVEFYYFDKLISVNEGVIQFFIPESLELASRNGFSPLHTEVNETMILSTFEQSEIGVSADSINSELLVKTVQESASVLSKEKLRLNLNDFVVDSEKLVEETVAEATIANLNSTLLLPEMVEKLNGYVIKAQEPFSLLDALKQVGIEPVEGEQLNIVATGLYKAFLQTNFEIFERHIGLSLPEYAELGFDAIVLPKNADLKIFNSNYYDYKLALSFENNQLSVLIEGLPLPYLYEIVQKNKKEIEPRKIVHFSPTRRIGDKAIVKNGQNGYSTEVYRQVIHPETDQLLFEHFLFEDFYPPVHQEEEWSLRERPVEDTGIEDGNQGNNPIPDGGTGETGNQPSEGNSGDPNATNPATGNIGY